jgi:hypothetical protein
LKAFHRHVPLRRKGTTFGAVTMAQNCLMNSRRTNEAAPELAL